MAKQQDLGEDTAVMRTAVKWALVSLRGRAPSDDLEQMEKIQRKFDSEDEEIARLEAASGTEVHT